MAAEESKEGGVAPLVDPESGSAYGIGIEQLCAPVAGQEKMPVFDWQNKEEIDFAEFGGIDGVLQKIKANQQDGLAADEAEFSARREHFGSNARPPQHKVTYLELIWEGLHDFTLLVLIGAAVVSLGLGTFSNPKEGWYEGTAITLSIVLVLNVGAINDLNKDKKFRQLNEQNNKRSCKVIRDGKQQTILADELLVGDIVELVAGDRVPADGLLLSGDQPIVFDESAMTGESDTIKKSAEHPCIISGSSMMDGTAKMVVVGVGPNSVQGRALALLNSENPPTPLQLKLERLATQISMLGLGVAVVLLVYFIIAQVAKKSSGWDIDDWTELLGNFIICVTILVVAIPEGLPLAVTISLAYSVGKMQNDNLLVRHLNACETMGGATTICTDKTGTLTQNKMTVVQLWANGDGGGDKDRWLSRNKLGDEKEVQDFLAAFKGVDARLQTGLIDNGCLNAKATLASNPDGSLSNTVTGSKTEGAFLLFAKKCEVDFRDTRRAFSEREVRRYQFSSSRKRSSYLVWLEQDGEGGGTARLYVKGASEMVLRLCSSMMDTAGEVHPLGGEFAIDSEGEVSGTGRKREIAEGVINAMADRALRTIALGYRDIEVGAGEGKLSPEEFAALVEREVTYSEAEAKGSGNCPAIEDDITLCFVAGIQDPVREEVPEAVRVCQQAGITVRMVTGDNIKTAMAIGKMCGLLHEEPWTDDWGHEHEAGIAVEGPDFRDNIAKLPNYFDEVGGRLEVMARSAPEDKHLLVGKLIDQGQVVAVTGDGTNDGPALKKSDVGFAMGIAGTDVAKQASDIVIMDDNFRSIVQAVLWGRNVYDSIRKFLQFQLTVNIVALVVTPVCGIYPGEEPLKATQMLWVNLIMDTFAALALASQVACIHMRRLGLGAPNYKIKSRAMQVSSALMHVEYTTAGHRASDARAPAAQALQAQRVASQIVYGVYYGDRS